MGADSFECFSDLFVYTTKYRKQSIYKIMLSKLCADDLGK